MSQFEYVAIPVSLIMTFGIARLLSGFPYLVTGRRTYWVHTLWCTTAIVNFLFFWWAFWNASSVAAWTLGSYLEALLYPGLCYVGATIFVPNDASAETDWHEHFFEVRKSIFAVAGIATSSNLVIASAMGRFSLPSAAGLMSVGFVGLYVVGFLAGSERAQKAIVLLNAVLVVGAYAPLIYVPGS